MLTHVPPQPPAVAEEKTTDNQENQGPSSTNHTTAVVIVLPSAAGHVLDCLTASSEAEALDQAPISSEVVKTDPQLEKHTIVSENMHCPIRFRQRGNWAGRYQVSREFQKWRITI